MSESETNNPTQPEHSATELDRTGMRARTPKRKRGKRRLIGDPSSPVAWGGGGIGKEIGRTAAATFKMLEAGLLPAKKIGGVWCADKAALRAIGLVDMADVARTASAREKEPKRRYVRKRHRVQKVKLSPRVPRADQAAPAVAAE